MSFRKLLIGAAAASALSVAPVAQAAAAYQTIAPVAASATEGGDEVVGSVFSTPFFLFTVVAIIGTVIVVTVTSKSP